MMPGREYSNGGADYRYSINGQEKEKELNKNITTAEFWEYDSRIVRRWNLDPKPNVAISPYNCFDGNPIALMDPLGDTLRGLNSVSATRAKESIENDVKAICNEKKEAIMAYFKISNDNVSFSAAVGKPIALPPPGFQPAA